MSSKALSGSLCITLATSSLPGECSWFREASSFPSSATYRLLTPGASTGNAYYIQNVCERDAKLFFVQGRKMAEDIAGDNIES